MTTLKNTVQTQLQSLVKRQKPYISKQQQETLALAEHGALTKITLNKDFINIINLNLTRENSKRSRKSEKKSSKTNHITFENSVTATLRQSKLELDSMTSVHSHCTRWGKNISARLLSSLSQRISTKLTCN